MVALLHSGSFFRLVNALKAAGNKKCVVVEQCCGGLITASIMAQPGASRILVGGSVVYDTKSAKPLLLNNDALYDSIRNGPPLLTPPSTVDVSSSAEEENYIASKLHWTAETSVAFCQNLGTDYAIAEGS
jgi:Competence-damaged protein